MARRCCTTLLLFLICIGQFFNFSTVYAADVGALAVVGVEESISRAEPSDPDIALDSNGVPYVAYGILAMGSMEK